ncbi:hypothetical protein [Salibacterium aidingense]|uniref:hypothetical protein n=1 Tax=Salibacterium aidingense TaxID=384933 RepID=UPI000400E79E|nr:hypothetical protein [Salibacterium aidingense]
MNLWESFDKNEISIFIMMAAAYTAFFLLSKKFSRPVTLLFLLWGYTIGVVFDFTIGGGFIDFYKLNDTQNYELFDFLYYSLFAPAAFFFVYVYELLQIKKSFIWYIIGWALLGTGMQWPFAWLGIIDFQNGYQPVYSFPVFLTTLTVTGFYYERVRSTFEVPPSKEEHGS